FAPTAGPEGHSPIRARTAAMSSRVTRWGSGVGGRGPTPGGLGAACRAGTSIPRRPRPRTPRPRTPLGPGRAVSHQTPPARPHRRVPDADEALGPGTASATGSSARTPRPAGWGDVETE